MSSDAQCLIRSCDDDVIDDDDTVTDDELTTGEAPISFHIPDTRNQDDDEERSDRSCCARQQCCYLCSGVDFVIAISHVILIILSLCAVSFCFCSKVACEGRCLLSAIFFEDGGVHYNDEYICNLVLYTSLVSASLPVLCLSVSWIAQLNDNKNWLYLQTLMAIAILLTSSIAWARLFYTYKAWCDDLVKKFSPLNSNYDCNNAIKAWDNLNEDVMLEKLDLYTFWTLCIFCTAVVVWAVVCMASFTKVCQMTRKIIPPMYEPVLEDNEQIDQSLNSDRPNSNAPSPSDEQSTSDKNCNVESTLSNQSNTQATCGGSSKKDVLKSSQESKDSLMNSEPSNEQSPITVHV